MPALSSLQMPDVSGDIQPRCVYRETFSTVNMSWVTGNRRRPPISGFSWMNRRQLHVCILGSGLKPSLLCSEDEAELATARGPSQSEQFTGTL